MKKNKKIILSLVLLFFVVVAYKLFLHPYDSTETEYGTESSFHKDTPKPVLQDQNNEELGPLWSNKARITNAYVGRLMITNMDDKRSFSVTLRNARGESVHPMVSGVLSDEDLIYEVKPQETLELDIKKFFIGSNDLNVWVDTHNSPTDIKLRVKKSTI